LPIGTSRKKGTTIYFEEKREREGVFSYQKVCGGGGIKRGEILRHRGAEDKRKELSHEAS